MIEEIKRHYRDALIATDRTEAEKIIGDAEEQGMSPYDIIFEVILPVIDDMLNLFVKKKEISLSQHYMTSLISGEIVDSILPRLEKGGKKGPPVVIGSASGDYHGLGRKILGGILKANLFEVIDLGLNVSPVVFIDKAQESGASIIGVSSMMVHTATGPEGPAGVRRLLKERILEGRIKLIVGGAPYRFDKNLYKVVGADGYAETALESVDLIRRLQGNMV